MPLVVGALSMYKWGRHKIVVLQIYIVVNDEAITTGNMSYCRILLVLVCMKRV